MCGICGVVQNESQGPLDIDVLERMRETLAHRGPDEAGIWLSFGNRLGLVTGTSVFST